MMGAFLLPVLKRRLLETVYREPGIGISELLRRSGAPVAPGYALVEDFLKLEVLKEEVIGRKPTLRKIYPDLKSELGILAFSVVEAEKAVGFLERHPELTGPLRQFREELATIGGKAMTALIFGSYARGGETPESDIDLLIVVSKNRDGRAMKEKLAKICGRCFVTVGAHVSARTITESEFKKSKVMGGDPMLKTIIRDHICVFNHAGAVRLAG